jgi:hypothetical protein
MVGEPSYVKQLPLNHMCKIGLIFMKHEEKCLDLSEIGN